MATTTAVTAVPCELTEIIATICANHTAVMILVTEVRFILFFTKFDCIPLKMSIFFSGRCEMNSTNQLGGLFSEFDDRRGSRSGNRSFSNDRNGGFQNQQTDKPFSRRNNNDTNNRFNSPTQSGNRFNDFQRDHRQNDRWMGFKPDYGSAGFFSNNGHASNRSDFGGNVYGSNGNGNGNGSGNGFGANRSNMSDINTVHLVLIRGMPFYCDEMDVCNVSFN